MTTNPELQESTDFFEPALLIPIGAKVYRIKPPSAETVIILQNARAAAKKAHEEGTDPSTIKVEGVAEDETSEQTQRRVFGDTYDELVADGVSAVGMFRMTQVIMIWTFSGVEAAKAYVATGGKALTLPNRAERRTATRTRTAAASTKTASRTTTSTRKATAAKATAGPKSSATGTTSKPTSKTSA
jgi:hypothetical protein